MVPAVFAALGLVMGAQELAETTAGGGQAAPTPSLTDVAVAADAGSSGLSQSRRTLSARVDGVSVTVTGDGETYRTGDISITGDSAGSGVQAYSLNTGVASVSQSSASIAAGSVAFGLKP